MPKSSEETVTQQCSEHHKLTGVLEDINKCLNEIKGILIGDISGGEYKSGVFDKLKAIKRNQVVINSVLITVFAGTIVIVVANVLLK